MPYFRGATYSAGQKRSSAIPLTLGPTMHPSRSPLFRPATTNLTVPAQSLPWSGLPTQAAAEAEKTGSATPAIDSVSNRQSRWFGYGYSFWRIGTTSRPVFAPAGQYGGSQSGFLIGYDLGGNRDRGPAFVIRAAATPSAKGEEFALAMRWRRPLNLPFSINGERRVSINGPDRWAVYAAGGFDSKPLPAQFRLDGYGQAGWASGEAGGAFFDAQLRATRQITNSGGANIRLGGGAWAGGQKDAHRIDLSSTVALEIPVGELKFDARLDWRKRVGGDAQPSDGIAITLSSGF